MNNPTPDDETRARFLRSLREAIDYVKSSQGLGGALRSLVDNMCFAGDADQGVPTKEFRKLDWQTMVDANRATLQLGGLTLPSARDAGIGEGLVTAAGIRIEDPQRFLQMMKNLGPNHLDYVVVAAFDGFVTAAGTLLLEAATNAPNQTHLPSGLSWVRELLEGISKKF